MSPVNVEKYNIDHSVARQLLPNGQRNLLIVTANIRSWINFMNQRLCNRNTSEIQYISYLIREDLKNIVPICSEYMAPDCIIENHCTQKEMSCNLGWSEEQMKNKLAPKQIKQERMNRYANNNTNADVQSSNGDTKQTLEKVNSNTQNKGARNVR